MIIIARKLGQTVQIGDCVIKIHEIKKSRVVLAVDAPPDVKVSRMKEQPASPSQSD